ncbi:MAG: OmpA family protein [Bacteroidales bacterium]|nr:OmpA family protein [Bacteroidales bacterium]
MKKSESKVLFSLLLTFCLAFLLSFITSAQRINIPDKVKNKAIDRADQRTDQGIDKGLDKAEEGIGNMFKKDKEKEDESSDEDSSDDNEDNSSDSDEVNASKSGSDSKKEVEPKLESYTKYDFVPGEKIILFDDFKQDEIGDFPGLWTTNGTGEVRTLNKYPGNWFYLNSQDGVYNLMKDMELPDNFILEFDMIPTPEEEDREVCYLYLCMYQGSGEFLDDGLYPGQGGVHIRLSTDDWYVKSYNTQASLDGETQLAPLEINKLNHVIIWVQKRRLRIYHKGQKVVDLPTILYTDVKMNRLRFSQWDQYGYPYVSNIRLTTAAPDTRSKLLTEGKLVSYGIYFDVNSDVVKPESYGALKDIAKVLNENPDVRIKIVGHTDSDGDDASNKQLSVKRAQAVKKALNAQFGVADDRMESDGKGESEPLSSNSTSEGKAINRRVEFIKL